MDQKYDVTLPPAIDVIRYNSPADASKTVDDGGELKGKIQLLPTKNDTDSGVIR